MTLTGLQNIPGEILLVEHSPKTLQPLADLFTGQGHKVRQARTGAMAVEAAMLQPPDLILLDLVLPETSSPENSDPKNSGPKNSGYEICQLFKANEQTREIPIIFVSRDDSSLDKTQVFQAGAVDYITQPFNPAEILAKVKTQLQLRWLDKQFGEQNLHLQQEIRDRLTAQVALETLNRDLEAKIQERTTELNQRNEQLLRLQAQLEHALAQNQRLNELKSELINTISHEFRTPLSVITLSAKLLKHLGNRAEEISDRYFQNISDSISRMQQVLDNAITLSQAKADVIPFEPKPLLLTEFCQVVVSSWKLPDNSPHHLAFRVQGTPPAQIYADSALLQHILTQLISNAIRYSPQGGSVLVELTYEPQRILLTVIDEGIGIPRADLDKICERFYRASNASKIPGTPGAGLGLAVVKWAVDLYKGSITIESEEGKGTTFIVVLPLSDPQKSDPQKQML